MPLLPDSGDLDDMHDQLGTGEQKPGLLTDATWAEITSLFQLRGEKGRGGQAVVFEAKEKQHPHRRVAIKIYHDSSDASRKAFENECRVLASDRLPPEVVSYFHCVGAQGQKQSYIVLEFIDGTTLAKLATDSKHPLKLDAKVELISQVARSWQQLHECNLVFGDGSANNILIEKDFRVRFIDMAGAKELIKGHGRSRSSINLVTPGFVAQTENDSAATKEVRTNLASDLYALSANAFLLLTGRCEDQCRSTGSRTAEAEWNRALAAAGVPRGLRAIVLKGLRVPDPLKATDLRLYPTAAAFADDIANWKRGIERRRNIALVAALLLIVAIPGALGWFKWDEARKASDLVASRRIISDLQQQVGELATREHAAVKKLLDDSQQSLHELENSQARGELMSVSVKFAGDAQSKLRRALDLAQAIERGNKQRAALGSVLLEKDRADKSEFWATGAPTIRKRLTDLQRRYVDIGQRLEQGDVGWLLLAVSSLPSSSPPTSNDLSLRDGDAREAKANATGRSAHPTSLATALADLQADLVALFEDNLVARQALLVRASYEREKNSVSERVQKLDGFVLIHKTAQDGEQEFEIGDFKASVTNYGRAIDRLTEYLQQPGIETPEERSNRQRVTVDLVKTLEGDKAQLQSRLAQLSGEIGTQTKTISGLQGQIAQLSAKQLEDQAARKTAETERDAAKLKAKDADATKTALTKAESERDAAKKSLGEQATQLKDAQAKASEAERYKTRAKKAEELLTALPANGTDDGGEGRKVIVEANKVASLIDARLKALDTKDREAAIKERTAAVTEWQKQQAELQAARDKKTELLKVNAADGKEVLDQDRKIAALVAASSRLEATVEQAQLTLDAADWQHYDEREDAKTQYANIKKSLMGPPLKRLANHPDVVQQDENIAQQTREQVPFAAGAARAAGSSKKLTHDEIVKLSGVPPEVAALAVTPTGNLKPGELRIIKVKGIETRWHWIPPGNFKMGSPSSELGRDKNEDQVDVTISKGFWMLETEVTQELWTAITGSSLDWSNGNGPKHPAYNVSHTEATEFCEKFNTLLKSISEAAGLSVSLPTEAQWEYAARAETTTRFYWGDDDNKLGDHAWHFANSNGSTHPVGQKTPNKWGLCDMSGSVREWCGDWYAEILLGGGDPRGASSNSNRCCRGGSWRESNAQYFRPAKRDADSPSSVINYLGFRLAAVTGAT